MQVQEQLLICVAQKILLARVFDLAFENGFQGMVACFIQAVELRGIKELKEGFLAGH